MFGVWERQEPYDDYGDTLHTGAYSGMSSKRASRCSSNVVKSLDTWQYSAQLPRRMKHHGIAVELPGGGDVGFAFADSVKIAKFDY